MNTRTHPTAETLNPFSLPRQLNDAAVSAWADSLPLANRDFSVRALLAIVKELNRKESIPRREQLAMLERLRPLAEMLVQQYVGTHLTDEAFPLSQEAQRVANRCFLLALEMARGYRRIAIHPDFANDPAIDVPARTMVLHRSLQAYGQALLRVAECYQPSPQNHWRDIYGIYRIAEAHDLLSASLTNPTPGEHDGTIRGRFATIALFSLLTTNRYRPREIRQIYTLIDRFANAAEIRQTPVSGNHSAPFAIDLGSDRGPYRIPAPDGEAKDDIRFLFMADFMDQLLGYLAAGNARNETGLSETLIKRLVRSFGPAERRKSRRLTGDGEHVVIVGLKQMIDALWRGRRLETLPAENAAIQYKEIKWLSVPDFQVEALPEDRTGAARRGRRSEMSIAAMLSEHKGILSRDDIGGSQRVVAPGSPEEPANFSAAEINSSARGYCLLWTHKDAACLRVGELVGFPARQGALHVGVVRWLHQDFDGELMVGVELLAPKTQAVTLAINGRDSEKGLFAPADKRLSREAAILVQPARFDVGLTLTVMAAGESKSYRIETLLESSPSFQQFALAENVELPVMLS